MDLRSFWLSKMLRITGACLQGTSVLIHMYRIDSSYFPKDKHPTPNAGEGLSKTATQNLIYSKKKNDHLRCKTLLQRSFLWSICFRQPLRGGKCGVKKMNL
ncbi:UNVERIFIED_CONTAM: hypothetical protein K2H54_031663 [Gekko kuhli]